MGEPIISNIPEKKENDIIFDQKNNNLEKEKEREKIIFDLQDFINQKGFKDETGNLVKIEHVVWPSEEEKEVFNKINNFIENKLPDEHSEMKDVFKVMADYIKYTTTLDSIKTTAGHSIIRREIEHELSKLAFDTTGTISKEEKEKYLKCHLTYYYNRLSGGSIERPLNIYDGMFDRTIFSDKTNTLFDNQMEWFKNVDPSTKKYQVAHDAEKLYVSQNAVKFITSFFDDFEKICKGEKV